MKKTSAYFPSITSNNAKKLISFAALGLAFFLIQGQAQAQEQNDPPSRVARVGYSYGQISFADAGSNEWTALIPNRPISTGDSIFVPERGRAELHVGSNAIRLSEDTRISFAQLSDDQTHIQLNQGSVSIHVRALFDKERFDISTPNLLFAIQEPGEYRININDDNTTTVIVRSGLGIAQGSRDVVTLSEGEQTRFMGTNLHHTQITQAPSMDTFDLWALDRSRSEENSVSARYVSREVIGYQELDQYGSWESSNEYGSVWYPRGVSSQWAPYRDGQWVWVSPWGWTWVDSAPWGFAPYHYGRWTQVRSRWAWIPGQYRRDYRPVYAPALVAFVGTGGRGVNVGISISAGSSHGFGQSVSWFPLGPHEVYRPSYTQNPRYIRNINQTVINNTTINNTTIINGNNNTVYINQNVKNAVTTVPTNTFIRGERIRPGSSSILSGQVRQLQAITQAPSLTPDKGNRYGDARGNNIRNNVSNNASNNVSNIKPSGLGTVYGSGSYAGGAALPVAPRPDTSGIRTDRGNTNANPNTTNNGANNASVANGTTRFNAERFDANSVSENTRRNEAYRNTPNNPRAQNNPAVTTQQVHTVERPVQMTESSNRMLARPNEAAVQVQQFRPAEAPVNNAREDRAIRVQRERPQEMNNEQRSAAVEMRAPSFIKQAAQQAVQQNVQQPARVEARPFVQEARSEVRRETPARENSGKASSKVERNTNIE